MGLTILETLQNADYNICNHSTGIQVDLAKEQLHNAVSLLNKGYNLMSDVDDLLEQYGDVDSVPFCD